MTWSRFPPRIDHIDLGKTGGHGPVTHGITLRWLSLAVDERAIQLVARLPSDHLHRVPEVRRADLIRDVLEHADDFAAADLVKELTAELRVVTLLVDRERPIAHNGDPPI